MANEEEKYERREAREAAALDSLKRDPYQSLVALRFKYGLSVSMTKELHRMALSSDEGIAVLEEAKRKHAKWKAQQQKMELMLKNGHRVVDIARETGFTQNAVRKRRLELGLPERKKESQFFVYGLFCPESTQCFYVGITENPWKRLYFHIKKPVSKLMGEWIGALVSDGHEPQLRILSQITTNSPLNVEREWIERMSSDGHPLMNREIIGAN